MPNDRRHLNGYPDRPSVRPNISLGDSLAGLHADFGAVMALHAQRRLGGAGQVGCCVLPWECGHDAFAFTPALLGGCGVDTTVSGQTLVLPSAQVDHIVVV